ncbi:MAG: PTS sugar transporter subunit IIB [Bifidobacteriaceae bacterium]|jgi:PTS system cellobiose-specific IIB component|nr:PTS sugar transporter subunit IIB [Bifidobacteriaceae bacterium]
MINILLVCAGGMSSSALVKRMEVAAAEKGIDARIWAVGDAVAASAAVDADVIMLGPQIRYLLNDIKKRVNDEKPVQVIDMMTYGRINGAKVLEDALALLQ